MISHAGDELSTLQIHFNDQLLLQPTSEQIVRFHIQMTFLSEQVLCIQRCHMSGTRF